jgi:hypothetical protein
MATNIQTITGIYSVVERSLKIVES